MSDATAIQRVLVIGSPAAGKSHVAQHVGTLLKLPIFHLDAMYYLPGWVDQNEQRWTATLDDVIDRASWVIDGNFIESLPQRMPRADLVIWLDYDRPETMRRVMGRMILPQTTGRADLAEGCKENWSVDFLIATWKYFDLQRPQIESLIAAMDSNQALVKIMRPKDLRYFLDRYTERIKRARIVQSGPTP